MKIAVVGSRRYPNEVEVRAYVRSLRPDTIVVTGGASGVDTWAHDEAVACWLEVHVYRPDYDRFPGRRAPLERNVLIAKACDELVAFWDGISTGTQHVIGCAKRLGKPVTIVST